MDRKTAIVKIRKLKALSDSSNPHEADTAKLLAAKLMEDHGITEREVGIGTDAMVKLLLLDRGSYHLTRYEMELALTVSDANDCVAVFYQHPDPEKVFTVGEKANTLATFEQYHWLLLEVGLACRLAARKMKRAYGFYWKRSFWAGALLSLDNRFEELKKEKEPEQVLEEEPEEAGFIKRFIRKFRKKEETAETGLAKRDSSAKAEDWAKDELRVDYADGPLTDPGTKSVDGMAYRAGMIVGEKIDLLPGETKELSGQVETATPRE